MILCDLMMPDLTGADLYAAVSKLAPEQAAAIVFMTGGAFTEEARSFLQSVPNPYVEKPFRAEEIRNAVNRRIGGARGSRAGQR